MQTLLQELVTQSALRQGCPEEYIFDVITELNKYPYPLNQKAIDNDVAHVMRQMKLGV